MSFTNEYSGALPPPPDDSETELDVRKLWIGNLDSRITEFAVLKLLQKYGELEKLDFLYHKQGPEKGKPRGFCFVTYLTLEAAEKAKKCLNGKLALKKRLIVRNAKKEVRTDGKPSSCAAETNGSSTSNSITDQIQAIEAKLDLMEKYPETKDVPVCEHFKPSGRGDLKGNTTANHRNKPYNTGRRYPV